MDKRRKKIGILAAVVVGLGCLGSLVLVSLIAWNFLPKATPAVPMRVFVTPLPRTPLQPSATATVTPLPPFYFDDTADTPTPTLSAPPDLSITSTFTLSETTTLTPIITPGPPTPTIVPGDFGGWCIPWNSPRQEGRVVRVIDPVTFQVQVGEKIYTVKYLGIDPPTEANASPDRLAEAEQFHQRLIEGRTVLLIQSPFVDKDPFGHWLRYVISGSKFINQELVEQGRATSMQDADPVCGRQLAAAQVQAIRNETGIWAPLTLIGAPAAAIPIPTIAPNGQQIIILSIFYEGVNPGESDEYVTISNLGNQEINLVGWRLNAGDPGQDVTFGDFILGAGQSCKLFTNEIQADSCAGISFQSDSPVWNNGGDCAKLFDQEGNLVSEYCY